MIPKTTNLFEQWAKENIVNAQTPIGSPATRVGWVEIHVIMPKLTIRESVDVHADSQAAFRRTVATRSEIVEARLNAGEVW